MSAASKKSAFGKVKIDNVVPGAASAFNPGPLFGAVLTGVLLFLSFPKFGCGAIAWVALIPLLIALRGKGVREAVLLGFTAGLVFHVGILYWIAYVVVKYGSLSLTLGIAAMLLLCAYLSLYTAAFAAGCVLFRNCAPLLAVPLLWTGLEFIRGLMLTGFPWEALAYSQYRYLPLIQITDITGPAGLSFLIVAVNALLFQALIAKRTSMRLGSIAAIAIVFLLLSGYGLWRLADVRKAVTLSASLPVSLIQGNIDQNLKWNPRYQRDTVDAYLSQSARYLPPAGGVIVWPETAVPFYFQDDGPLQRRILAFARDHRVWIVLGSPTYADRALGTNFANSAFIIDPAGRIAGRYDKVHLVPYGEYVPLRRYFPFIGKLAVGVGDFRPGRGYFPLSLNGHRLGILICYEGIFPGAGTDYKRRGAEMLVNITNDAWFGPTSAPYQHLSMTVFRAVETRLSLCRAANTGISAFISPTGQITKKTGLFLRSGLSGEVRLPGIKTIYSTYGDFFAYSGIVVLLGMAIVAGMRRKHERDRI
ncbi:MAG TPA: apolipoprotein N-acyltransferase [Syntrophales bacterium]|nr:apolipoprotein N-acyltransferase [Syntrophales bacterium]